MGRSRRAKRAAPIAASAEQQAKVLKRREAGDSLGTFPPGTELGLTMVRTIVEKADGKGRTSERTNEARRREFDRLGAAAYRARKKRRDSLPKDIGDLQKFAAALVEAAKGLGVAR